MIHIIKPYRQKQGKEMGLEKYAKLIWLLDCQSVHMSKDFTSWVKEKYPQILLIFVPANCTSILQPTDVMIQRPFKHSFRQQFDNYTSQDIGQQLEEKDLKDVKFDTKITVLKPLLCSWLYHVWQHVIQQSMIKKGWAMCGLDKAFCSTFQTTTMNENMKTPLFKKTGVQLESDTKDNEDDTDIDLHVECIMNENLNRVYEISTLSKNSISTLKGLARKRYKHS